MVYYRWCVSTEIILYKGDFMDRIKKIKLYFVGYFLFFPILFITSSFLWRAIILKKEMIMVATDALAITGIYYLIVSLISILVYIKDIKSFMS